MTSLTDDELALLASMFDLARDGHAEELSAAVAGGVPANLTNGSGDTLLILGAYHDQPDVVRVLLRACADTERENDRGQTALGAAVFRQSRPNVRALLAAGARPETGARCALDVAAFFGLTEMVELLEAVRTPGQHERPSAG